MEVEQAWAPSITPWHITNRGKVLDPNYKVKIGEVEKVHTLYYLESDNVFVTVEHQKKEMQVVADFDRISAFKEKYLDEMSVDKQDFSEYDINNFVKYKSDINIHDYETIKRNGQYLGKAEHDGSDLYYLETSDAFAAIVATDHPAYLFQSHELRKKYNIPYQDERFETMTFY
jgi:hypothetical protein